MSTAPTVDLGGVQRPEWGEKPLLGGPQGYAVGASRTFQTVSRIYRLLCLSRNLTFDRSWDTVLVLDGELTGRKNASGPNNPLGAFFAALPHLAVREVPPRIRESVDLIQHELRRVRFEIPEGFDSISFPTSGARSGHGPRSEPLPGRGSEYLSAPRYEHAQPQVRKATSDRLARPLIGAGRAHRRGVGC